MCGWIPEWIGLFIRLSLFSLALPIWWAEEWESPLALWQQREVVFCVAFFVTDTLSHQQFHKYPKQNWNTHNRGIVGQKYNLKRACQKPLGDDGWGRGWLLSPEVRVPDQSALNKRRIKIICSSSFLTRNKCLEYNCTAGSAGILPKWIYLQLCKPLQQVIENPISQRQ